MSLSSKHIQDKCCHPMTTGATSLLGAKLKDGYLALDVAKTLLKIAHQNKFLLESKWSVRFCQAVWLYLSLTCSINWRQMRCHNEARSITAQFGNPTDLTELDKASGGKTVWRKLAAE